ncbi:YebC/PmpR family DNA-binding transcriptional regulator [bacterium]|nr:YebC/PmpR family DNA-binding transcriptional regulator [bacterium]
MSGHSKWSTIKRKKGKADAARGRMFTRLIREITTAAREGGGDDTSNPRLRTAIDAAKAANMPAVNIEKAIKRGTGELPGVIYEEKTYEGYGPGGVAIIIETLTDNTNRTTADVRHLLSKYSGNLGESGCVAWMFEKKGVITIDAGESSEESLMEIVLEAGADDLTAEDDEFEIICRPEDFNAVLSAVKNAGIAVSDAEITMIPKNTIDVEGKQAEQVLKLMEGLDDCDDVQKIHSNFNLKDIPEEA